MNKSLRSALPSLRPMSPANIDTPRGVFSKSIVAANPRFSSDFEVNRALFKFQAKAAMPAKKRLEPLSQPRVTFEADIPPAAEPEMRPQTPKKDLNIMQIEMLLDRIPTGNEPVPMDEVYKLSPVMDRVLCVVSEWKTDFVKSILNDPTIVELQNRLYALIEIDDFLLRTIICRILLSFATDSDSPLLLPVARIFYKLSCDQTNDGFFVEESLETVLVSLIRIAQPEARVFAAGAIRNIAASEEMRKKITESDFLALICSIFEEADSPLKIQLLGAIKQLSKSEEFRRELSTKRILSRIVADSDVFTDALRIISMVPEISSTEKSQILGSLMKKDLSDDHTKRGIIRAMSVLADDSATSAQLLISLLKASREDPEWLVMLLQIAHDMCENDKQREVFERDSVIMEIVKEQSYDTAVCLSAYTVLKMLKNSAFEKVLKEYEFLDEIKASE